MMKEVIYVKEVIDQTCPYATTDVHDCYMQCGNHCPHFEFVPATSIKHKEGGAGSIPAQIIITCSGTPVNLKVKE